MFNLFDILQGSPGGDGVGTLARQFGLSAEQAQRAVDALLPAFALGLQRTVANPMTANPMNLMGFGQMGLGQMGLGQMGFGQMGFGPPPQGSPDITRALFGAPDVTRQVAQQAAMMSGLSPEVLMRMLPVVGTLLMGGLAREMAAKGFTPWAPTARPAPANTPGVTTPNWGDMMKSMFDQVSPRPPEPPPAPEPQPFQAFVDMMAQMMRSPTQPDTAPAASEPLGPAAAGPSAPEEPGRAEEAAPPDPVALWGRMVETGREAQEQYLASLRAILDGGANENGQP